jgi:acidic leucine-rich nuclear phosphoprotein 32 family protein A/C/D
MDHNNTMEYRIGLEKQNKRNDQVTELILDNCRASQISGLTDEFINLETLSLINVGLTTLKGFPKLPKLKKLEISDNRLTGGLNLLHGSPNLQHLNISGNRIKDIDALEPLKEFHDLISLDLYNCEVTKAEDYRKKVFDLLPNLKALDGYDREEREVADSDEDDEEGSDVENHITRDDNESDDEEEAVDDDDHDEYDVGEDDDDNDVDDDGEEVHGEDDDGEYDDDYDDEDDGSYDESYDEMEGDYHSKGRIEQLPVANDEDEDGADDDDADDDSADEDNVDEDHADEDRADEDNADVDNAEEDNSVVDNAEVDNAEEVNAEELSAEGVNAEEVNSEEVNAEEVNAEGDNGEGETADPPPSSKFETITETSEVVETDDKRGQKRKLEDEGGDEVEGEMATDAKE